MIANPGSELTVLDLLKGDLQLASPPNLYFQLKKTLNDPTKKIEDAAKIIELDAAMTAKLLKIVNSAYYGFPAQIASISRAINIIGNQDLQNLVLSTIIIERFSHLPGMSLSMHDFWARNLKTALLAKEIDDLLGSEYQDIAFLCAILHDIGQLVFFRRLPVLAREIDLLLQSKTPKFPDDEVEIEERIIGFNHYQTGAELCRLWKLPEIIIASIEQHCLQDSDHPFNKLASIVRTCNLFVKSDTFEFDLFAPLQLDAGQLEPAITKTNDQFEEIFHLFYS